MKKVLYAKFSRERSIPFQISTAITEENGKRSVEKQALTDAAREHIGKLSENEKKLKALYSCPELEVCPCRMQDERTAVFPFLEGKSMENLLTEHVEQGDFGKVKEDVELLWKILLSSAGLAPFEVSQGFTEIFGNVELPEGLIAAPVSNLDMIFANLLKDDTQEDPVYHLVDYEWVFDFMVPVSFIFARSLMLHGMLQTLTREQLEELYAIGGVRPEEIPLYYNMEVSFQRYVTGQEELHVLSRLYPKMKTCCFFLDYWNTQHLYYKVSLLGVLKDRPEQLEELYFSLRFQGEVRETIEIPDTGRYQEFVLRPADTECIIKMYGIEGERGECTEPAVITEHSAQVHYDEYYHFEENPVFRIKNNGYNRLSIGYVVCFRDNYLVKEGIGLRLENAELQKKLNSLTWPVRAVRKARRFLKEKVKPE